MSLTEGLKQESEWAGKGRIVFELLKDIQAQVHTSTPIQFTDYSVDI